MTQEAANELERIRRETLMEMAPAKSHADACRAGVRAVIRNLEAKELPMDEEYMIEVFKIIENDLTQVIEKIEKGRVDYA